MVEYLARGNYLETAAAMANVSKSSVFSWLKLGHQALERYEEGEPLTAKDRKYKSFLEAVKKAEAEAEVEALDALRLMGGEAWQSICWRLERRHNERWGRRQAIEVGSAEGKPVKVQRVVMGGVEIEF